jgi:hypothetical protein
MTQRPGYFINAFYCANIVNYNNQENEKLIVQQENIFLVSF